MEYYTHDFYSAVILRASGFPILDLIHGNDKFVTFHFKASPSECNEILSKHWNRTLKLETRLLFETIGELRTRLHSEV